MPEQQKIISLLLDYLTVLVFNWLEQSGFRFIKTAIELGGEDAKIIYFEGGNFVKELC